MDNTANNGEFVLFVKLPTEIRTRIWFYALPGLRIISLFSKLFAGGLSWKANLCDCVGLCDILPAIAQANREARDTFFQYYDCRFGTHVRWDWDTIYLSAFPGNLSKALTNLAKKIHRENRTELISLAIPINKWVTMEKAKDSNKLIPTETVDIYEILRHFPQLKELLVIGTVAEPRWSVPKCRARRSRKVKFGAGKAFTQIRNDEELFEEELDNGDFISVGATKELARTYLDVFLDEASMMKDQPFIPKIHVLNEIHGLRSCFIKDAKASPEELIFQTCTIEHLRKQLEEREKEELVTMQGGHRWE
ncbi:uncharacterized protein PAC_04979 [Phialocephala subalpina]|uniref:2EXR domain-containing protein n=1 Tax=Phialocephala subalpina TaxID=576137 RepID=A0A1L7WQP9_9HELO|nr:uncharacterized protein PAC_04979 [Phialocephala subalpina]